MKAMTVLMWTAIAGTALSAAGCDLHLGGHSRNDRVLIQEEPRYVEAQPQYIVVQEAPPPIIVERRPAPPSRTHVWIDGYWQWDSQRYNWQAGRYATPPQADVVWVAPRYEREGKGYRYSPGQWKKQHGANDHGKDRN